MRQTWAIDALSMTQVVPRDGGQRLLPLARS